MDTYKRNELAKAILASFLVGGLALSCAVVPGIAHLFTLFNAQNAGERSRVRRSVKRLEQKGLLTRRIRNGKEELLVTRTGKQKLAEYIVDELKIQPQKKWDKKWRVVMFDIPEKKGHIRREVSFKIKDIGMVAMQDSVFVSPFPCKKEVDFIVEHYSVRKHVIYLETDVIELTEDLLEKFDLKGGRSK